jgi:hypothetical protein
MAAARTDPRMNGLQHESLWRPKAAVGEIHHATMCLFLINAAESIFFGQECALW